jgi:hypothetical protein
MIALRRLALGLALLFATAVPAGALERIVQFISDVAVQRNGDLAVTETIQVEAEGKVIRRGIFRDFPTTYTRPDGTRVVVGFDVGSVTRNGSAENFVIEAARERCSRSHRQCRPHHPAWPAYLCHPLPYDPPDRVFRRLRRALLECDR